LLLALPEALDVCPLPLGRSFVPLARLEQGFVYLCCVMLEPGGSFGAMRRDNF